MYSNDITQQSDMLTNFICSIYSSYISKGFSTSAAKKEANRVLMENVARMSKHEEHVDMGTIYYVAKTLRELIEMRLKAIMSATKSSPNFSPVVIKEYNGVIESLKSLERMCTNAGR